MIKASILPAFLFCFFWFANVAAAFSQSMEDTVKYDVEVIAPGTVENIDDIQVEFIVTKGNYTGPLRLKQQLPEGFSLISNPPENVNLEVDANQYLLSWSELPGGDKFRFVLRYKVTTEIAAVYPFPGEIMIDGNRFTFSASISVAPGERPGKENLGKAPAPVSLRFEYPDLIGQGQVFTFVTTFVKKQNYTTSGELLQVWPEGFTPQRVNISNAGFEIRGRLVVINWKQMANEPEFSIAYKVKADTLTGGTYPVITEYHDDNGLDFQENVGLFVQSDEQDLASKPLIPENPVHIEMQLPAEAYKNNLMEFSFQIRHPGVQGQAALHLKFPPGSALISCSVKGFTFDPASGMAICRWEELPEGALTRVSGRVDISGVKPAVYPVMAAFGYNAGEEVKGVGQLRVTNRPPEKKKEKKMQQPPGVDTSAIFSRLDKLLEDWKNSTSPSTSEEGAAKKTSGGTSSADSLRQEGLGLKPVTQDRSDDIGMIKTCYCIQVAASKTELPDLQERIIRMGIDLPLQLDYDGDWYRYMLGRFKMLREAINHLEIVRNKGFPDAFIVNYLDGIRSKRIY